MTPDDIKKGFDDVMKASIGDFQSRDRFTSLISIVIPEDSPRGEAIYLRDLGFREGLNGDQGDESTEKRA